MESTQMMSLIVTKSLIHDIRPELVRCCPTMDLIAIVTCDERVEVFRLSGQRAFGVQRKTKDVQIESLCWKYNGQYLAVSWSDGIVEVISTETGNALHNFRNVTHLALKGDDTTGGISIATTCLGWGMSLLDGGAGRSRLKSETSTPDKKRSKKPPVTIDDFLEREPDLDALDLPVELPEQLAGFDATELMPKLPTLSVLPATAYRSGQTSLADLFASQTLLDAALHKGPSKELDALNTLLLSDSQGTVRIVVYDSLSIGNISLPGLSASDSIQYLRHYSHPFSHCHVLLSSIRRAPQEHHTALVPVSLRFLKNAGRNIHFIDYKTAQLDTLVQYIGESILAIHYHWKHGQELPSRFRANIEEDLAERNEPTLSQSLYQLAATGYCSEKMSEWLKDELAERGHKRWDQAVSQGYVKLIELIQENLLPALDRCNAILTNLQGLAQYHEQSSTFDVPISSFTTIQDILGCIRSIGHHMILFASEEQRRFASFSTWLRYQIDVQASDPTSATGQDLLERESGVDYTQVFSYIEKTLGGSKLEAFLCHPADSPDISTHLALYNAMRKTIRCFEAKAPYEASLLKLPSYYREWCKHHQTLIEQITSWQRSNAIIPGALILKSGKPDMYDIRMIVTPSLARNSTATLVATASRNSRSQFSIFRLVHSDIFDNVSKSVESCEAVTITIPDFAILELRFADDEHLFILGQSTKSTAMLSFPIEGDGLHGWTYSSVNSSAANMKWPDGTPPKIQSQFELSSAIVREITKHTFSHGAGFVPDHFEVNGRKDRRFCVMIGQNKRQFGIFDLDRAENQRRRDSIGDRVAPAGADVMIKT